MRVSKVGSARERLGIGPFKRLAQQNSDLSLLRDCLVLSALAVET